MTTETAFGWLDLPVIHEFEALFDLFRLAFLVGGTIRLPAEVEHVLDRSDVLLRIAVAVQTEGHTVRLGVLDGLHLVDTAMTFYAADASVHVRGVVKIYIIGGLVYLDPLDGLTGL